MITLTSICWGMPRKNEWHAQSSVEIVIAMGVSAFAFRPFFYFRGHSLEPKTDKVFVFCLWWKSLKLKKKLTQRNTRSLAFFLLFCCKCGWTTSSTIDYSNQGQTKIIFITVSIAPNLTLAEWGNESWKSKTSTFMFYWVKWFLLSVQVKDMDILR